MTGGGGEGDLALLCALGISLPSVPVGGILDKDLGVAGGWGRLVPSGPLSALEARAWRASGSEGVPSSGRLGRSSWLKVFDQHLVF